jgi:hypothetical protein
MFFNKTLSFITFVSLFAISLFYESAAFGQAKDPIRIGYGIALTGPLAPNGKSALFA